MGFIYFNPNPQQKVVGDCTIRAPAAVEEYLNVSRAVHAQIWAGMMRLRQTMKEACLTNGFVK